MTRIQKMVLKGFKSFGEKTEMIFDKEYSCILGPNGSGKSNIGDALCFVLGKGSAKSMRAEKSANLIYNGGKSNSPAKFGEVSIYFDNKQKRFPLETEDVKITRTITQNGQSIYRINDQKKTRQEILELLSVANIDPDGYNIILQGDIVRFVEMSPIERRQIIEDIAGIGIYQEKKDKALHELEKVDQKVKEAEIILAERKTYLKDLKKERDQAAAYKELSDNINRNKATYLTLRMNGKREQVAAYDEQITAHQTKIVHIQASIDQSKQEILQIKEQISAINREVEEKGEKDQVAMLKEIEQLKVAIETNKVRITTCQHELERIGTRKGQLNASLEELEAKITQLHTEQQSSDSERQRIARDLALIEAKILEVRKKNNLEGAEDIDKQLELCDSDAEEKQKAIQVLREEQQNLLREKDKLEYQIHALDENMHKVLEVEQQHKGAIEKLKQMKDEFKKATVELNTLLAEDSNLAAQIAHARQKLATAEAERAKLEAKNTSIRESAGVGIATKAIMENKDQFGLVYGTVSDLGKVKSQFALALEIAAGPKLKSIVVDNDKTAAACIAYLKRMRLGTATFLPLNKIRPTDERPTDSKLSDTRGVFGKAVDLVEYDSQFKNVFQYVFGSTLIVETIDVARRIGIGNVRMTTIDGDLVETSGAMHGGFREKKRAALGFQEKEVTEDLERTHALISDLTVLVSSLEEKRNENEKTITRLRTFRANLDGDIITQEKSLHLDSGDLEATKKARDDLLAQLTVLDEKMNQLSMQVSTVNRDLATIKIKKQQLRDQITQLRNPLLLAELNTFEQKRAELRDQILAKENSSKNITMQIQNILLPEKTNIVKILKQHDKEEETFRSETLQLEQTITVQKKELAEKEEKQKAFYGAFKALFEKRNQLNDRLQKIENSLIVHEENIRAVEQKRNLLSIEQAKFKAEFAGLEEEFKAYEKYPLFENKTEEDLKKEIWEFEKMVERLGNVNLKALEIYESVEIEYNALIDKKDKLLSEKNDVFAMINEIETKKKDLFLKTFEVINQHFKEMFLAISRKGEAFLELENETDPLSEGVCIKVRITGKKFMDIRSLSGGEKTLTALAFIFAIQEHEPASFYIFDEVDAALDKHNSEKLSKLIRKYSEKAQYIIISHNDGLISEADILYGVSMTENNMSKVVSLRV